MYVATSWDGQGGTEHRIAWPLPRFDGQTHTGVPGDWVRLSAEPLWYGIYVASGLATHLEARLFEVEFRGDTGSPGLEARLTRELQRWNDLTSRLFALDCAEHVLPYFEAHNPHDSRPRNLINAARRLMTADTFAPHGWEWLPPHEVERLFNPVPFAWWSPLELLGATTDLLNRAAGVDWLPELVQLTRAWDDASQAGRGWEPRAGHDSALHSALMATMNRCRPKRSRKDSPRDRSGWSAARHASEAARTAAGRATAPRDEQLGPGFDAEYRWQVRRLWQYLVGRLPTHERGSQGHA